MNRHRIRRYPGLHYFTTEQKAQFFGRDEEKAALLALVLTEKIVALFGKSGYGKSSLLRAGLVPELPPDWLPIVVQLGAYQAGQSLTPLERTLAQLDAALPDNTPETAFLEKISAARTLWHRFRRKQGPEKRTFLLLFDQFEEFQTYPADQREAFKKQVAELLYTRIPQAVRDADDDLSDEEQALLARPNEVKALFALREDRLSVLDGLADKLPAILHKRYHLKGLDDSHAQEAILKPAALPQGDRYESPAFTYTQPALEAIKRGLKKDEQDTTIESFLLQICCEEIERGVIERAAKGAQNIEVAERDLPVFEELFEQYYRNKIAALPDEQMRMAARRMIEDQLVKTDAGSGIAYRINADGRALCALPGVDEALLKRLTDVFLLRSEPNTTGGFSYEVSHDRLVEGILAMKQEYEAEEAEKRREQERIEAERRAREAEEKAAEERRRAEEAKRLQKEAETQRAIAQKNEARARTGTRLALLVSLIALALALFAGWSYKQAQHQRDLAQEQTKKTKDALNKVEQEKKATEKQRGIAEANLKLADENLKKAQAEEARARAALAQVEKEKAATEEQRQAALRNFEEAKTAREEAEKQSTKAQRTLNDLNKANEAFVLRFLENARKDMTAGRCDDAYDKIQTAAALNVLKPEVCKAYLANADSCLLDPDSAKYDIARKSVEAAASIGALAPSEIGQAYIRIAESYILNLQYDAALRNTQAAEALKVVHPDTIKNLFLEAAYWYTESGNTQRSAGILDTLTSRPGYAAARQLLQNLPADSAEALGRLRAVLQKIDAGQYERLQRRYYPVMVSIPGGKFRMGEGDEAHDQEVSSFQLAATETTLWQFGLYCAATGRDLDRYIVWFNAGDNPVVNVSWYDAVEYANWVSRQKGAPEAYDINKAEKDRLNKSDYDDLKWIVKQRKNGGYRLPTEAEWEYAAGGGSKDRTEFAGTDSWELLKEYGWYNENNGYGTRPVGVLKPNALGLHDMSGNVWEWCWDWHELYPKNAEKDYAGPGEGSYRVYRGGGWRNLAGSCRAANRNSYSPTYRYIGVGFRLALQ